MAYTFAEDNSSTETFGKKKLPIIIAMLPWLYPIDKNLSAGA